ncbi:hypothetical protein Ccrd_015226 [Cynara cardunculus var. scolymus]|uniref:Uncharacterized protein n=1 Tax=Cynara cardunculus var. scolymus TaxID=59895 RepID=A0A103YC80_CYNCS|nr:hypothetical protein Ccrd_015226 [Cynara cardunculus var. scolymus]
MKVHPAPNKRNITVRYDFGSQSNAAATICHQKKLRRLPHIFAKVLELPFYADADVSIEETNSRTKQTYRKEARLTREHTATHTLTGSRPLGARSRHSAVAASPRRSQPLGLGSRRPVRPLDMVPSGHWMKNRRIRREEQELKELVCDREMENETRSNGEQEMERASGANKVLCVVGMGMKMKTGDAKEGMSRST